VVDCYGYDAYGVMLGGNPNHSAPAATSLLYAGEQFDLDSQHYYNRARWYDALNGRFNRTDPFFGNLQDPQSLHKYLYAHANPVNNIDPSGNMGIGLTLAIGIVAIVAVFMIAWTVTRMICGISTKDVLKHWDSKILGGRKIQVKINGKFDTMSADEIFSKYKTQIKLVAVEENIPSDLLAGVFYTELSGYGRHDLWFDNPDKDHSIGPAQLEVSNVKSWLSSEYGSTSNSDLADMLYDPESAIKILAKCIKYFDSQSQANIISEFRNTNDLDKRARLSSLMNSLKDAGGLGDYASNYYRDFAENCYRMVISMAPELKE
jgi:RHS repeat-associated protein